MEEKDRGDVEQTVPALLLNQALGYIISCVGLTN
jgi:hypothetical protein